MYQARTIRFLNVFLGYFMLSWLFTMQAVLAQNQTHKTDSLLIKAKQLYVENPTAGINLAKQAYASSINEKTNNQQIKSLNLIADFYWEVHDNINALNYAQQGLRLAQKSNIDSLIGDSWVLNGLIDYDKSDYAGAINKYERAIGFYTKDNLLLRLAITYQNLGVCEKHISSFEMANFYYFKAANILLKLKSKEVLSHTYNSIGLCFLSLSNYSKAIEYLRRSLVIREALHNKLLVAESFGNIGYAYKKAQKIDSAITYLSKSVDLYKNASDSSDVISPLQNLGSSWRTKGDLKKANDYILRSLKIASVYDMKEEVASGILDLAEVYFAAGKYKEALAKSSVTIAMAQKLNLPELLMDACSVVSDVYKKEGNYKAALLYDNKKNNLKDSIFTTKNNRAINELEIKYQTDQKVKDIAALSLRNSLDQKIVKQQRLSITVLVIAAVLLLLLFAIAYNSFRVKNKANQRIQTLMRDLHHRVKNNLQILSGLFTMQIENLSDENTKIALRENEARLTSMNLIHNKLYLDNTTTKIEMNDYLTKLLNHIKDSFVGYKQSEINLRIEVSNIMLEADKAVAIGLIANELATNAFKYAFTETGGEIHLGLKLIEKSKLLLTLCDNGVGLKEENKDKAPSFGLRLVNLMARQLNSTLITKSNPGVFYQMEINI